MLNAEYQFLNTVKTLDEANEILQQHHVSKYRTSNSSNFTKYSYRCSQYRKHPLCRYEIQVYVPDDDLTNIRLMFKNAHCHEQRNVTTRLPSPVRESVAKYVKCNLTQGRIKDLLNIDYPNYSLPTSQLSNLISYARRQKNPEIFSVYDFIQWCNNHQYNDNLLHSTFVPYFRINNINDIFVFFTTKHLIQLTKLSTVLQIDATYKLTWNELPLLVFGASDADRHFRPFGLALISSDEGSSCFKDLFNELQRASAQECKSQYLVHYVMADGAAGKLVFNHFVNMC